LFYYL